MDKSELDNRFMYHAPSPMQVTVYAEIRAKAKEFAVLLDVLCPESREKALAFTELESAVMWANASIARRS